MTTNRMSQLKFWISPALLLAACAGFLLFGRWQLERAEVNRAIESSFDAAPNLPTLMRPVAAKDSEAMLFRRIRLAGRYAAGRQVLLDSMTRGGRAGYEVLTPFRLASDGRLVLVNRGFVAADADRQRLPDVSLEDAAVTINGRVGRLPRSVLNLGAGSPEADGKLAVLLYPDFADIEAVIGESVHPFVVLLDPSEDDGFERDWQPERNRDERNLAYAVQWFALAGLAAALAAGIVVRRRGTRARHET